MKTPTNLLPLASRNAAGASAAQNTDGTKTAAAVIVNVTALDPGATLSVSMEAGGTPIVQTRSPIDRPCRYVMAHGDGLALDSVNAQGGLSGTTGDFGSVHSAALPANWTANWSVSGGAVTFSLDVVTQ